MVNQNTDYEEMLKVIQRAERFHVEPGVSTKNN